MAARLPAGWIDELRSRVDIVDVASDYVELKPKGRRFWGRCPFHSEKTPSFSVDSESQMYYCFGCHKGGTVINFVMDIERMEFMDAIRMLAERAHMDVPALVKDGRDDVTSREKRERIYEAHVEAARFYHKVLWTNEGAEALKYLYRRGLDDAGIRRFGLGATPHGGDVLTRHLTELGFDEDTLITGGLSRKRENRTLDVFWDRVMFPIINAQGKVLGFGGRVLGDGNPKYLNTADTPIFNKKMGLYAMNFVRQERGLKRLILVEGYMDVVSLRLHGIQGVVATLGTALTVEQARLIKRYVPEVWVCYDGDSAGQKAILRAIEIFDSIDMPCHVIDIPGGQDPDDYVKAHGAEGFEALTPIAPVRYKMLRAAEKYDLSDQEGRTQYAIECCKYLSAVTNPVEVENYLRDLMLQTGFERDVLVRQIGTVRAVPARVAEPSRGHPSSPRRPATEIPEHVRAEQLLLNLLTSGKVDKSLVTPDVFVTDVFRDVVRAYREGASLPDIIEELEEPRRELVTQALMVEMNIDRDKVDQAAADCMDKIGRYKRQERSKSLMAQLKTETDEGRKADLLKLLAETMNTAQSHGTGHM